MVVVVMVVCAKPSTHRRQTVHHHHHHHHHHRNRIEEERGQIPTTHHHHPRSLEIAMLAPSAPSEPRTPRPPDPPIPSSAQYTSPPRRGPVIEGRRGSLSSRGGGRRGAGAPVIEVGAGGVPGGPRSLNGKGPPSSSGDSSACNPRRDDSCIASPFGAAGKRRRAAGWLCSFEN